MRALDARNRMSHVYSTKAFDQVVEDITTTYFVRFDTMRISFEARMPGGDDA